MTVEGISPDAIRDLLPVVGVLSTLQSQALCITLGAPSNAYQSRPWTRRTFLFGALRLTNMGTTSTLLNEHLDLVYCILPSRHDLFLTLSLVLLSSSLVSVPLRHTQPNQPSTLAPSHKSWSFSTLGVSRTYTLASDAKPPSSKLPSSKRRKRSHNRANS